jgi:hypothetical protein
MKYKNIHGLKKLTASQKIKAQKIVNLITELEKQGVHTVLASTPSNMLTFYRNDSNRWIDSMEEIQEAHNWSDKFFNPEQACAIIDTVAY